MNVELKDLIRSSQPFVILETQEPHITTARLRSILRTFSRANQNLIEYDILTSDVGPEEFISKIPSGDHQPYTVFVMKNIQFYLSQPPVIQALHDTIPKLKDGPWIVIGLGTVVSLPTELERWAMVISDDLPTEEELKNHADLFISGVSDQIVMDPESAVAAAKIGVGMTYKEFEDSCALSATMAKELDPAIITSAKRQLIQKSDMLDFYYPTEEDSFDYIYGLENLKKFTNLAMREGAKGIMLLGVPGTGKSAFCRALAGQTGVPMIQFDVSSVFGKFVGESESRMRQALKTIEAFGSCILFLDEIEKALAGAGGSGATDSGVTSRTLSILLRWLSDNQSDVYLVATCNDIKSIPPEYLRAERWDTIFFIDIPTAEEREGIWKIWRPYYDIPEGCELPDCSEWTGAEIRTCCRLGKLMRESVGDVIETEEDLLTVAGDYVIPITRTMGEGITKLRSWAKKRTIAAGTAHREDSSKSRLKKARRLMD